MGWHSTQALEVPVLLIAYHLPRTHHRRFGNETRFRKGSSNDRLPRSNKRYAASLVFWNNELLQVVRAEHVTNCRSALRFDWQGRGLHLEYEAANSL